MERYLEDYNLMSKAPMDLVMFRFAIEHVSRLSRVLKQPNGHCLCVGTANFEVFSSLLPSKVDGRSNFAKFVGDLCVE